MKTTNTPEDNIIGKQIRTLRLKKGWSQGELGKFLLISTPAVSKIEAGLTTINMSRIRQLAEVLETSVQFFLMGDSYVEQPDVKDQLTSLRDKIATIDAEISDLQEMAVKLYEELIEKRKKN
jgi:transcriptional regulator with XRE-family HTH domain